jgi:hypothetical protein
MVVDRIEVYLDGTEEPLAVLKEPPYRLKLDTRKIPDGEHTLKVVTHFRGGGQEIREIPFTVNNYPDVLVVGLDEGGEVAGEVELRLAVGEPELPVEPVRFNPIWYAVALVVVLGGIWAYFALSPAAEKIVAEVAPPAAQEAKAPEERGPARGGGGPGPHGEGEGHLRGQLRRLSRGERPGRCPGPSRPWRATPTSRTPTTILNVVKNGRQGPLTVNGQTYDGQMPAFPSSPTPSIKAVATYIRNSFGNSFGPVE